MARARSTVSDFAGGSDDDFLVHGDQLAQRGDPRGELVHVQHALAAKPKDRKLRAAQAKLFADHPGLARTEREPFEVTLRRARRELDVVFRKP